MIKVGEPFIYIIEQRLGGKLSPPVRNVFLQVPRHLFVQQYYQQQSNSLTWDLVPATQEKIYQDEALVTQIDRRGIPSSSTSQPSVMAAQLEALDLAPGQRVLEIGVGTGYNAALIDVMVGDDGQVISIDIDEDLVERAKQHLALASVKNVIALPGDGFLGKARRNKSMRSYMKISSALLPLNRPLPLSLTEYNLSFVHLMPKVFADACIHQPFLVEFSHHLWSMIFSSNYIQLESMVAYGSITRA